MYLKMAADNAPGKQFMDFGIIGMARVMKIIKTPSKEDETCFICETITKALGARNDGGQTDKYFCEQIKIWAKFEFDQIKK